MKDKGYQPKMDWKQRVGRLVQNHELCKMDNEERKFSIEDTKLETDLQWRTGTVHPWLFTAMIISHYLIFSAKNPLHSHLKVIFKINIVILHMNRCKHLKKVVRSCVPLCISICSLENISTREEGRRSSELCVVPRVGERVDRLTWEGQTAHLMDV